MQQPSPAICWDDAQRYVETYPSLFSPVVPMSSFSPFMLGHQQQQPVDSSWVMRSPNQLPPSPPPPGGQYPQVVQPIQLESAPAMGTSKKRKKTSAGSTDTEPGVGKTQKMTTKSRPMPPTDLYGMPTTSHDVPPTNYQLTEQLGAPYYNNVSSISDPNVPITTTAPTPPAATSTVSSATATQETQKPAQGGFVCNICQKELVTKGSLKTHSRVHTGERPFVCPKCLKSFTQQANCARHIRLMHPEVEGVVPLKIVVENSSHVLVPVTIRTNGPKTKRNTVFPDSTGEEDKTSSSFMPPYISLPQSSQDQVEVHNETLKKKKKSSIKKGSDRDLPSGVINPQSNAFASSTPPLTQFVPGVQNNKRQQNQMFDVPLQPPPPQDILGNLEMKIQSNSSLQTQQMTAFLTNNAKGQTVDPSTHPMVVQQMSVANGPKKEVGGRKNQMINSAVPPPQAVSSFSPIMGCTTSNTLPPQLSLDWIRSKSPTLHPMAPAPSNQQAAAAEWMMRSKTPLGVNQPHLTFQPYALHQDMYPGAVPPTGQQQMFTVYDQSYHPHHTQHHHPHHRKYTGGASPIGGVQYSGYFSNGAPQPVNGQPQQFYSILDPTQQPTALPLPLEYQTLEFPHQLEFDASSL